MRKTIYTIYLVFGLIVPSAVTVEALAQTVGEITGEIRDPSGAMVGHAVVTAVNQASAATRTTTSNEAGVYSLPSLQPGVYNLKVESPGFLTVARTDIQLQVQQTLRIDFPLQIGGINEAIEVHAGEALLATESATVGTVIENRRIIEIPLNGRNFLQLVSLSPNVSSGFASSIVPAGSVSRQGGSRVEQNISIAGQRSMFNRFTLDGIENTDVNFNTYIVLPSIDALQEFKVQSGVYPAQFGRAASQINVSTRPGSNQFHGALFEFLRNDKLDARAYAFTALRPPREPFRWNQYGFTLGGPVQIPRLFNGRNRLFFMSNFEGYRDRKQLRGFFNVPSLAMRGGDFSEIANRIYDPATRTRRADGVITAEPFPGNVIPRSRIHPLSIRLLEFYPEPNVDTGSLVSNYQAGLTRRIDKDQFNQRIDFVESKSSTWFGRYSWGDELQLQEGLKLSGTKLLTNVRQGMISNTRVLSASLVNEFRFGYSKFFNNLATELADERDVIGELQIPGLSALASRAWGTPRIVIAGLSPFGDQVDGPFVNNNHVFQWMEDLSWARGKHTVRFGAEVRHDRYNQVGNSFTRGEFVFTGSATQNPVSRPGTGFSFADYLLGQMANGSAAVNLATAQLRATSQYYYVDDRWKLRSNLTLEIGLRYENTPPWFDQSGTLVNAYVPFIDTTPNVQDLSRHPTLVRIGSGDFYENSLLRFNPAIQVARDGRLGERLVARDNNDFAPRLGIAWSPTSRWVVRSGFGVFYSQDAGNPRSDMARNLAGRRVDQSNLDFPDLSWNRPFNNAGGTLQVNSPFVLANVHERRTPYSLQYMLNLQYQLDRETLLETGYLGSVSRKLESLRLLNQAIPGSGGSVSSRLPYPEFDAIQEVDGSGKASYNALAVKLQRRFSHGLTYLLGYTWSRSIDTASAIRPHGDDWNFPQNSYCLSCERGLSSFHAAHRLVASTLYELPLGRGRKYFQAGGWSNVLLGGWQLGSILTLQTGFPINVRTGGLQSNTNNGGADRPNATGVPTALPRGSQDPERFFNTAAFVRQPLGTFGNAGRNTVIGPGLIAWDFSTLKNFSIREGQQLQFRVEAFNLPNHPNWGSPGKILIAEDFGKIRSTRTPMRELQFGLKYIF